MFDLTFAPSLELREPGGPTRRRFLQGAAAAATAAVALPSWLARAAAAGSAPLAVDEGMLVVVSLRGGNDSLNTLVPTSGTVRTQYQSLRGTVALPISGLLPAAPGWGLHPKLPKLADRFARGRVALVQGVGLDAPDLSHFVTGDRMMAGTATADRSTGWLGRFLDGAPGWDAGVAGLGIGTSLRLLMVGVRANVPALPSVGGLWGADTAQWDRCAQDALREMAAGPAEVGPWGDELTAMNLEAMEAARDINPLYLTALPTPPLTRDLTLAARALNSDVGTRVVSVELAGWDTHASQLERHAALLEQLDAAIEAFWATLSPALASRVTMLVLSEFGRRPAANGSKGTDHGSAGLAMVIGENVRGGLTGAHPSLSHLDAAGNAPATVDFRSLYASVLSSWLRADDREVLGATYPKLDLFVAGPGAARP